jgi:hypothetical protein
MMCDGGIEASNSKSINQSKKPTKPSKTFKKKKRVTGKHDSQ